MSRIISKALAILAISLMTITCYATESHDGNDLKGYIAKYCKKDCVDHGLLLTAIKEAAEEFNVGYKTLLAIVKVESGFMSKASNRGKSVGLMSVQLYWHKSKFLSTNYYDVFDNVRVGTIIFKHCSEKSKGNLKKSLLCYNGGGDPMYVPKVTKALNEIKLLNI